MLKPDLSLTTERHVKASSAAAESGRAPERATEGRIEALDGLRGLMALAVVVYHFAAWTQIFGTGTRASSTVAALGVFSVEGFFVISGFCFFHLYGAARFDARELWRFHIRRFFRIAPLYYFVLALNLLLAQAVGPSFTWGRLAENATLTFGLFHPNHAMVLGGWSVGIEYAFYLAFPALAWATRLRGGVYVLAALAFALAWPYLAHRVDAAPYEQKFHTYVRLPSHAFLFLIGGAIADARQRTRARLDVYQVALGMLSLLVLALVDQPLVHDHVELLSGARRLSGVGVCVLAVLTCALCGEGTQRALAPLVWLGDHSYALYLVHPLAWLITDHTVAAWATTIHVFALGLVLSMLLAAVAHGALERPFMALGRRLSR